MAIKALKCPNCGGIIEQFDESMKKGFCPYCDSIILDVQEKQVEFVQFMAKFQVEGISTVDNLLARAQKFLDDKDLVKAEEYANKVLDIDIINVIIEKTQLAYAHKFLDNKDYDRAEEYAKKVLQSNSNNSEAKKIFERLQFISINGVEVSLLEIKELINNYSKSKSDTIKNLRLLTGIGLVEAKFFLESAMNINSIKTEDILFIFSKIKTKPKDFFVLKDN